MIQLIVYIVVLGLLYWCTTLLPLPDPFPIVIKVLFIILLILVLLSAIGVVALPGWGHPVVVR